MDFFFLFSRFIRAMCSSVITADTRRRKQMGSPNIAILLGVFNKTIISLALVEYEIVIANEARRWPRSSWPRYIPSLIIIQIFFARAIGLNTSRDAAKTGEYLTIIHRSGGE